MDRVAITCTHLIRDIEDYRENFAEAGLELVLPEVPGQELRGDELVSAMEGISGVIAGDDHFTSDVLAQLPGLRVISKWGIGLDAIDLDDAAERGVTVTNTPGMFGNEVAEQGLAYLFALVRGIIDVDRTVRAGGWPKPRWPLARFPDGSRHRPWRYWPHARREASGLGTVGNGLGPVDRVNYVGAAGWRGARRR